MILHDFAAALLQNESSTALLAALAFCDCFCMCTSC
jgi:hypothetical protein